MKLRGKNLFDEPEIMLQNRIFYESTKANILRIELNQFTLNRLNYKGIFGFRNVNDNNYIPITIDNGLEDFVVSIIRN